MTAKFRKLMGIKQESGESTTTNEADNSKTEEMNLKHAELFQRLDREYEFARMTTHTHRGVGLGFASQGMPDVWRKTALALTALCKIQQCQE